MGKVHGRLALFTFKYRLSFMLKISHLLKSHLLYTSDYRGVCVGLTERLNVV